MHFFDKIEVMSKSDPACVIIFTKAANSAAKIVIQNHSLESDAMDAFEAIFTLIVIEITEARPPQRDGIVASHSRLKRFCINRLDVVTCSHTCLRKYVMMHLATEVGHY